jgi:hypothetical protein
LEEQESGSREVGEEGEEEEDGKRVGEEEKANERSQGKCPRCVETLHSQV